MKLDPAWRVATDEMLKSMVTPPSSHIAEIGGIKYIKEPDG